MYLNTHSYYSLRYGTLKPEALLQLAFKQGVKAMALTDINSTSANLDFVRLAPKYSIKPVLGVDFRNGVQQQFILLAKNNNGFQNINQYLSAFLHDGRLKIPGKAPQLEDTFVVYPYKNQSDYELKGNEFLGIKPQDLNKLKFSKFYIFGT
mgnify:CR=1 FL=1